MTELRDDLADVRDLVVRHGWNATAYQILNPGIERWFPARRDAVVGYVTSGGYRVVAGSPVCSPSRLGAVIEEFEHDTHARGLWSCYFAADERLADELAQRGPFDRILLGAQPVWDPHDWPGILERKASLRAQLNRARNKDVSASRWPRGAGGGPSRAPSLPGGLAGDPRPAAAAFPGGARDAGSSLRPPGLSCAVQGAKKTIRGFLVASPIPQRNGWLIEQIIRGRGAPNGTSELLLDAAWRDLADSGADYVTLGLSPLSQRADVEFPHHRAWLRFALGWVRAHGRRFYDFDGLDAFKAKFLPQSWEPIWAITSERRVGLGTLWAISGAFGQMSPPRLLALALWRGLVKEIRWLRDGVARLVSTSAS